MFGKDNHLIGKLSARMLCGAMIVGSLAAPVLGVPSLAYAEDIALSAQAGNNMAEATSISLGTQYSGNITSDNTADYYAFTLRSPGRVTISGSAENKGFSFYLHDSSAKRLWSESTFYDSTAGANRYSWDVDLQAGTYYLSAQKHSYPSNYGTYSFALGFQNSGESFPDVWGVSSNNSMADASIISLESTYIGHIAINDEKDYYAFTLRSPGRVTISGSAENKGFSFYLHDSSAKRLWSESTFYDSTAGANRYSWDVDLQAGTYYLSAQKHSYPSNYGTYSFALGTNGSAYVKPSTPDPTPDPDPTPINNSKCVRLAGTDRYDTMSQIVSGGFLYSEWAVVATGENYPDALAASALAGAKECPVILTSSGSLSPQARSELEGLGVQSVYIMGGTGAVSPSVESSIRSLGISVTRVSGSDRMMTSVETMRRVREAGLAKGYASNTVVVATGYGFADTLSVSPWVWWTESPIILTRSDGTLTDAEISAIQGDPYVENVVIVGGSAVVSQRVESQLGSRYSYERLYGANRYETSKEIAKWAAARDLGWTYPAVATGSNFPDALAGSALCGSRRSVLLLASSPSDPTVSLLAANKGAVDTLFILGGTGAVSTSLENALINAIS